MPVRYVYSPSSLAESYQLFVDILDMLAIILENVDQVIYINETRLSSDSGYDNTQNTLEHSSYVSKAKLHTSEAVSAKVSSKYSLVPILIFEWRFPISS